MKYAWIKGNRDVYPLKIMLKVFEVSKSGYYKWLGREPGPRAQRTDRIQEMVKQVFEESNQIYGSRKIAIRLRQDKSLKFIIIMSSTSL